MSESPTPAQIRAAREAATLTQAAASKLVHVTSRLWQMWEAGEQKMHPGFWELFNLKVTMQKNVEIEVQGILDCADLARLLRMSEGTVRQHSSRHPERLPPRIPHLVKPRWLLSTVRAWMGMEYEKSPRNSVAPASRVKPSVNSSRGGLVDDDKTLDCAELARMLGMRAQTVRNCASQHPDRLPPRIAHLSKPLWRVSDVRPWMDALRLLQRKNAPTRIRSPSRHKLDDALMIETLVELGIEELERAPREVEANVRSLGYQCGPKTLARLLDQAKEKAKEKTMTVADLFRRFAENIPSNDDGSPQWELSSINHFIRENPAIADTPLSNVTSRSFADWRLHQHFKKDMSAATRKRDIGLYWSIFEMARKDWNLIERNPLVNPVRRGGRPRRVPAR